MQWGFKRFFKKSEKCQKRVLTRYYEVCITYGMEQKKPQSGTGRKPQRRTILCVPVTKAMREAIRSAARADSRPMAVWVRLLIDGALKAKETAQDAFMQKGAA
jgi:hypothetical protein